jgi:putative colanic acid biosynthesis acetyltransferase WcaF
VEGSRPARPGREGVVTDPAILVQDLSKFRMPPGFRGRGALQVQIWWLVQATLFRGSPQFLYGWRRWLLRCFGAKVGIGAIIRPSATFTYPWKISIGDWSWIGDHATFYSLGPIQVGSHSVVSQHCYLCAGTHDPGDLTFPISGPPIMIGDQCWLGSDVFVGPGRTIGTGTVVGARSSVFKDLPEGVVALGTPAVPTGTRPGWKNT